MDEVAIAYSDDPSKRAVLIAAALALVTDVVVTTQVHPALLRRVVRLAIPVVLTRPVAGILTGSASNGLLLAADGVARDGSGVPPYAGTAALSNVPRPFDQRWSHCCAGRVPFGVSEAQSAHEYA